MMDVCAWHACFSCRILLNNTVQFGSWSAVFSVQCVGAVDIVECSVSISECAVCSVLVSVYRVI